MTESVPHPIAQRKPAVPAVLTWYGVERRAFYWSAAPDTVSWGAGSLLLALWSPWRVLSVSSGPARERGGFL